MTLPVPLMQVSACFTSGLHFIVGFGSCAVKECKNSPFLHLEIHVIS